MFRRADLDAQTAPGDADGLAEAALVIARAVRSSVKGRARIPRMEAALERPRAFEATLAPSLGPAPLPPDFDFIPTIVDARSATPQAIPRAVDAHAMLVDATPSPLAPDAETRQQVRGGVAISISQNGAE